MLRSAAMNLYRLCLLVSVLLGAGRAPASEELRWIWRFDSGIRTEQGGYYNQFAGAGSRAELHLDGLSQRGTGGRSLQVTCDVSTGGYAGVWLHLFDEAASARSYLDASATPVLSFWARGERGGEDFTVQMADRRWFEKEDSSPAGPVSRYLGAPLSTNWQRVLVPAADARVDASNLASVVFNFTGAGATRVWIDDLALVAGPHVDPPPRLAEARRAAPPDTVLWVWETDELLRSSEARAHLLAFCAAESIDELFLQLPYRFEHEDSSNVTCAVREPAALRELLGGLAGQGVRTHALDGYPEFTLRTHHARVRAQVRAVEEFNAGGDPAQRFIGIHLDNEPHQLLGFDGPWREEMLLQFIELNALLMEDLRARGSGLVYGIDIPFWFDEDRDAAGRPTCDVTYRGVRQNAARHLIDIVDNIGIMAYRKFAGGADGIIRHAEDEVSYAAARGKRAYVGVETFRYRPTCVWFVYGPDETTWRQGALRLGDLWSSSWGIWKARTTEAGGVRLIGVARPEQDCSGAEPRELLGRLYARWGSATASPADLEAVTRGRLDRFTYEAVEPFVWRTGGRVEAAGLRASEVMAAKTTFAGGSRAQVREALREVADHFAGVPSFAGVAIHHYTTYRDLPER
jgi:hypothetical protein